MEEQYTQISHVLETKQDHELESNLNPLQATSNDVRDCLIEPKPLDGSNNQPNFQNGENHKMIEKVTQTKELS